METTKPHPDQALQHDLGSPCCGDPVPGEPALAGADGPPLAAVGPALAFARLRIGQMDCPMEEALIRRKLSSMQEVHSLEFDLVQQILTVVHGQGTLERIMAAIRSLEMTPEVLSADTPVSDPTPTKRRKTSSWLLSGAGLLAVLSEFSDYAGWPQSVTAVLALAAIAACGITTYRKGWIAVRNGNLNINALMSIAVTGAVLIGQWPEAAMVMVLFNLAEVIEARSLDRARNAVRNSLNLAPQTATVRQADGSWQTVAVSQLTPGDVIRTRPGERIAADGTITTGNSAVDQAAITGESLPVEKGIGDPVYAGTVNTSGSFEYVVTAAASDTTLARIIHVVEQAQGARAPTQRFIDQFSRVYTPVVVALAVLVAIVPPLTMSQPWFDAIYRALALLIIACPCALVISTPVTIVSGLTAASRRGILIKGGVYLEEGRKLKWLALDKTGTLTQGKPVRTNMQDWEVSQTTSEPPSRIAASLAARSDHPVSVAIARDAFPAGTSPLVIEDFKALPGRGVSGHLNGQRFYLGNHRLMEELGVCSPALEKKLAELENQGKTAVVLSDGTQVLLVAAVADTVKPSSAAAISDLHKLGIRTLMLTGDNNATARAIAAQVGIDEALGEQLPEDKLTAIENKLSKKGKVGMVGDGINDTPALARADIGFAMGAAGTGAAIETADVALMDDDLRKIPTFVRLSYATNRVLIQNIALSLGIKAIFLLLAVSGYTTLWMALFADMGASLLVIANSLRLLRAAA